MIICGADPGRKGALVALDTDSSYCNHYKLTYDKAKELEIDPLEWWLACVKPDLILMEKVHGRGGWGANQIFSFGCAFGELRTVLKSTGISRRMVSPQSWQALVWAGVVASGNPKEKTQAAIQTMYPGVGKLHEGVMDAFAMAWYGVHKYGKSSRLHWNFKNLR